MWSTNHISTEAITLIDSEHFKDADEVVSTSALTRFHVIDELDLLHWCSALTCEKNILKRSNFYLCTKVCTFFSLLLSALFAKRYTTKCSEWLYSQRQIIIHIRALLQASFAVGFERLMISRISFSETPFVCRRLVKPMYKSSRLVL